MTISNSQRDAVLSLLAGIVESVKAGGPLGVPGGTLYAALMAHGCSLQQFEHVMSALVETGKLTKRGELYFSVSP